MNNDILWDGVYVVSRLGWRRGFFCCGDKLLFDLMIESYKLGKTLGKTGDIKVVEYRINQTDVSGSNQRIEQEIELHYYLLNRNILKTMQHRQVWQFQEAEKSWLLTTPMPVFSP